MIDSIRYKSPIGTIQIAVADSEVVALSFGEHPMQIQKRLDAQDIHTVKAHPVIDRLDAYFEGDLAAIDDLEVAFSGTDFQVNVWKQLRRVPAGQTTSYSRLAEDIGSPRAVRAAGTAAGANPVGIIVPCHRMVRSDGSLGGYAGGLDKKQWLLTHELKHAHSG